MSAFPTLSFGAVAMYSTTHGARFGTEVAQFVNDSEQRWVGRPQLEEMELVLTDLSGYDQAAVMAFFRSVKGSFDSTWSITLAGITYNSCVFLSDEIMWTETRPLFFSTTLKLRQTIGTIVPYTGTVAYFPFINSQAMITQLPYTHGQVYNTLGVDMPAGRRWAFATRGAGLTNFPGNALHKYVMNYPSISDAETAILRTFFYAMNGRYGSFSILDPGGNMVTDSENFATGGWTLSGVTLGSSTTDPFGGSKATALSGAGTLTNIFSPSIAGANGFALCGSVWVRPHATGSVSIALVELTGGTTIVSKTLTLAANIWFRIDCSTILATNANISLQITVSGSATDIFGAQCSPTIGTGGYTKAPDIPSMRTKCRFDTDSFTVRALGPDQNSLSLPIVRTF
jgi:hypothetical protein